MAEARSVLSAAGLTLEGVLGDPSASFALKAVLRDWAGRDGVDAAHDAEVLWTVLAERIDRRLTGAFDVL